MWRLMSQLSRGSGPETRPDHLLLGQLRGSAAGLVGHRAGIVTAGSWLCLGGSERAASLHEFMIKGAGSVSSWANNVPGSFICGAVMPGPTQVQLNPSLWGWLPDVGIFMICSQD